MSVIILESVVFQAPARIGAGTVTGCSSSAAGGSSCEILFDQETRLVHITPLGGMTKKESIVPLSNVASMTPAPQKAEVLKYPKKG